MSRVPLSGAGALTKLLVKRRRGSYTLCGGNGMSVRNAMHNAMERSPPPVRRLSTKSP